jgi:N-acetylglutamate synthase-like GNAT family acetyltransferase
MFITRASRRDRAELQEFYTSQEWGEVNVDSGVAFFARQGAIVGAIRLAEAEPNVLMVEDVVVREDLRGTGIGKALMQAAMNSRGGKLYLVTHDDVIGFYEKFGFATVDYDSLPETVKAHIEHEGDAPHQIEGGHEHFFMTAR